MADVATQADLVICHAGHGTLSAMLLAGRPLLLLPKQLEQLVLSVRLCEQHLAYFIPPGGELQLLPSVIDKIYRDQKLHQAIASFQHRYHGFDLSEQAQGMLDALADIFEDEPCG
jgi:UDP:flavonoid glycosyltransferase YjiC (YdhE family)